MLMLFAIGHAQPRRWLPEEIDLIRQMLERTWLALEKAQADQALYEHRQRLEQQAQQLLENERHKNEFLSILGHELRNPLGAIHNTLQVRALQAEQSGQEPAPPAILERQVQHMHRLIDDLLDISRINAGKIELRRQPVSMADCVTTAVETLQPMIDAGGHKLSISLPRQPLWLDGDPVRLVQVLENLLMNAAKYSSQGGRIALKVERRGDHAVIRVRDNGIGISSIDLQSVFGMFAQSRAAQKHPSDGLGLGLALVKQLVELHDGQVEAFSEGPECGSEFVVTLPLLHAASLPAAGGHSATAAAVPAAAVPAAAVAVLPRRILIIDDNADNADSLTALLTALGHQTRAIYTGLAALTTVHRFEPECVFIDLSMPDMDGFEVARQLRHEYPVGTIVLIALSGYGSDDDIDTARAAGFDHHLLKPAGLDEITDLLASLR
jgi:signal transduction histidine kinase